MSKKLIITESEKNEIKGLYKLNEETTTPGFGDALMSLFNKLGNKSDKSDKTDTDKTDTDKTEDSYLNNKSSGSVDSKWMKVTKKVIDNFEGGYWNGSTGKNVSTSKLGICGNHPNGSMGVSTETMFGLDRYNGSIEKTSDGQEFFRIIDKQKKDLGMTQFCKKWKWNYKGGELEDKLKNLAAKVMKHYYDSNVSNYFSPELKKRVENNDRLLMHFSYGSWNGPGHFQKFAKSLNDGVKKGMSDKELIKQAIIDRKKQLPHQDKVASILTSSDLNLS